MARLYNPLKDRRLGERHYRAQLSNHEVELARALRWDHNISISEIARKLEQPRTTIRDICNFRSRPR